MWFIYFFIAQVVVAIIVIAFLRWALEGMLVDMALRQIEYWLNTEGKSESVKKITVVSYQPLKTAEVARLQKAMRRSWGEEGTISFQTDPKILGGMLSDAGTQKFDCSLRDRLRRAFPKR